MPETTRARHPEAAAHETEPVVRGKGRFRFEVSHRFINPERGGLLVTYCREDLAALALEGQQVAARFPLGALLAHKSHTERTRWAWKRAHLPLLIFLLAFRHPAFPVEAGARWRLSVTDNSQGPDGDVRSMSRYDGKYNPPVTQIEPLPNLT
jgi:hypothetical protein